MRFPSLLLIVTATLFAVNTSQAVSIRWPAESVDINVEFDTTAHTVKGEATISLPTKGPKDIGFLLNKNFTVVTASANGQTCQLERQIDYDTTDVTTDYGTYGKWDPEKLIFYRADLPKKSTRNKKQLLLVVEFSGMMYSPPDNRKFSREEIAFEVDGTIGKEGIFLSSGSYWYPHLPDCPTPHTVTARVPKGWNVVTNGAPSTPKDVGNYIEVTHTSEFPSNGVDLSAGPYVVKSVEHEGVMIYTYFLPAQADLADGYLEACKKYLSRYSALIGAYPFPKFAVVDNFLPSGYGMPGWTLLGSEVLRLPFIKETSLGHEILHNWFGNGIFVDYRDGNWCEGLTTYLADYSYKVEADSVAGVEYRNNVLKEYADFVNESNDYPVGEFVERSKQADRAIGYGKVMMMFHMLRSMLDQEDPNLFPKVIQQAWKDYKGKPMSWFNWRQQVERRLSQKLDWFFDEWLKRSGAPRIRIENPEISYADAFWSLTFEVVTEPTEPKPYQYLITFQAVSDETMVELSEFVRTPRQKIWMSGPGMLEFVRADPAYNVFRKIYPEETPLTLSAFMGDKEGILVVPTKGAFAAAYKQAAEGLKTAGQSVVTDSAFTPAMESKSLWIFGSPDENKVWAKFPPSKDRLEFLPGRQPRWKEESAIPPGLGFRSEEFRNGPFTATLISPHPGAKNRSIVYTVSMPGADPIAGTRKISHYGKQSYLMFENDTNIRKGSWAASGKSPMAWEAPAVSEDELWGR